MKGFSELQKIQTKKEAIYWDRMNPRDTYFTPFKEFS